ncbi:SDR family oxidoreductase [Mobilicoccus massiliensis]|uniref:SDR family oxidoreductase n=1 Tax=Mobilicoccus massiliensis TaxID=1522310 RepID=UPI00058DE3AC|nr:NAD(P)H-binding protein [Mobilicoccus massiliensis]
MKIAVVGATGTLGSAVVARAEQGHEVARIARSLGVDVLTGEGLTEALSGCEVVIDCGKPPTLEEGEATDWYEQAARTLGEAATAAGIARTVAVSIVGIDRTQDFPFYRTQLAHEAAVRRWCPGPVIVRSTQFHDFVGVMLTEDEDGLSILDAPSQPVDTVVVAEVVLDAATAAEPPAMSQIAGPREERTLDQARRLLAARGDRREVRGVPASPSMMARGMLPDADVPRRGPTYDEWLATHEENRHR